MQLKNLIAELNQDFQGPSALYCKVYRTGNLSLLSHFRCHKIVHKSKKQGLLRNFGPRLNYGSGFVGRHAQSIRQIKPDFPG